MAGLEGENHRFRVFAALRDDPFFNNVKGARQAYGVAGAALQHGTTTDSAGCPRFDKTSSRTILDTWRHTDGGPPTNFLAGWKSLSLVVSIDFEVVATGGKLLAVWSAVHRTPPANKPQIAGKQGKFPTIPNLGKQIERTARPLIKNALVGGPVAADDVSNRRKEAYNGSPGVAGSASRQTFRTRWDSMTDWMERVVING